MSTFLVTGATGDTGSEVVNALLAKGQQVKAIVHRIDHRSENLKYKGVEVHQGDLLNIRFMREISAGIHGAYFVYPIAPYLIEASSIFAQVAEESNVKIIVNMSQISARQNSESTAASAHWISEKIFDRFRTPVVHVRPTFFMEWFLYFAPLIAFTNALKLPIEKGRHAPISAKDQAKVITTILLNPEAHLGKTYKLVGEQEISYPEACEILSIVLERKIDFLKNSEKEFSSSVRFRMNSDYLVQHLLAVMKDYEAGLFSGANHLVEELTGEKAESLKDFFYRNKTAFEKAAYLKPKKLIELLNNFLYQLS